MRTTKKEFKDQVQAHILGNLCTDYTENVKEQLQNVVDAFKSWYGPYEQKRNPNRWTALTDWLLGLPFEMHVEFSNSGVYETLKQWFENCGETYKEMKADKEADLYYALIVREFLVLCKKHGVNAY